MKEQEKLIEQEIEAIFEDLDFLNTNLQSYEDGYKRGFTDGLRKGRNQAIDVLADSLLKNEMVTEQQLKQIGLYKKFDWYLVKLQKL